MKRYAVRLVPAEGWFHPFDKLVMAEPDLERVAIHNMNLLSEDVGQTLYEFAGDVERLESIMESLTCDANYQINERDGRIFNYLLFEPNDTIRQLLHVHHDHRLLLDPPQVFTRRGHLQLTYFGTDETFHEAMAAVPERITVKLERKSEFEPSEDPFVSKLTRQQTDILETAVSLGYYEIPRETSLEKVGEEVGLTAATVGEHLRKVERTLMTSVIEGSAHPRGQRRELIKDTVNAD